MSTQGSPAEKSTTPGPDESSPYESRLKTVRVHIRLPPSCEPSAVSHHLVSEVIPNRLLNHTHGQICVNNVALRTGGNNIPAGGSMSGAPPRAPCLSPSVAGAAADTSATPLNWSGSASALSQLLEQLPDELAPLDWVHWLYLQPPADAEVVVQACGRAFVTCWDRDKQHWLTQELLREHLPDGTRIPDMLPKVTQLQSPCLLLGDCLPSALVTPSADQPSCSSTTAPPAPTMVYKLLLEGYNLHSPQTSFAARFYGTYLHVDVVHVTESQGPCEAGQATPTPPGVPGWPAVMHPPHKSQQHAPQLQQVELLIHGITTGGLVQLECWFGRLLTCRKQVAVLVDAGVSEELKAHFAQYSDPTSGSCISGDSSSRWPGTQAKHASLLPDTVPPVAFGGSQTTGASLGRVDDRKVDDVMTDMGCWLEFQSAMRALFPEVGKVAWEVLLDAAVQPSPITDAATGVLPCIRTDSGTGTPGDPFRLSSPLLRACMSSLYRVQMLDVALQLLSYSCSCGWVRTASSMMNDILALGVSFSDVKRQTSRTACLMHKALCSQNPDMMRLVKSWADAHNTTWELESHMGSTAASTHLPTGMSNLDMEDLAALIQAGHSVQLAADTPSSTLGEHILREQEAAYRYWHGDGMFNDDQDNMWTECAKWEELEVLAALPCGAVAPVMDQDGGSDGGGLGGVQDATAIFQNWLDQPGGDVQKCATDDAWLGEDLKQQGQQQQGMSSRQKAAHPRASWQVVDMQARPEGCRPRHGLQGEQAYRGRGQGLSLDTLERAELASALAASPAVCHGPAANLTGYTQATAAQAQAWFGSGQEQLPVVYEPPSPPAAPANNPSSNTPQGLITPTAFGAHSLPNDFQISGGRTGGGPHHERHAPVVDRAECSSDEEMEVDYDRIAALEQRDMYISDPLTLSSSRSTGTVRACDDLANVGPGETPGWATAPVPSCSPAGVSMRDAYPGGDLMSSDELTCTTEQPATSSATPSNPSTPASQLGQPVSWRGHGHGQAFVMKQQAQDVQLVTGASSTTTTTCTAAASHGTAVPPPACVPAAAVSIKRMAQLATLLAPSALLRFSMLQFPTHRLENGYVLWLSARRSHVCSLLPIIMLALLLVMVMHDIISHVMQASGLVAYVMMAAPWWLLLWWDSRRGRQPRPGPSSSQLEDALRDEHKWLAVMLWHLLIRSLQVSNMLRLPQLVLTCLQSGWDGVFEGSVQALLQVRTQPMLLVRVLYVLSSAALYIRISSTSLQRSLFLAARWNTICLLASWLLEVSNRKSFLMQLVHAQSEAYSQQASSSSSNASNLGAEHRVRYGTINLHITPSKPRKRTPRTHQGAQA